MPSTSPEPDSPSDRTAGGTGIGTRALTLAQRALGLDGRGARPDVAAVLHGDEPEGRGLDATETVQLHRIRLFGATGAVLMAVGALGAGAQPVLQNLCKVSAHSGSPPGCPAPH